MARCSIGFARWFAQLSNIILSREVRQRSVAYKCIPNFGLIKEKKTFNFVPTYLIQKKYFPFPCANND